MKASRPAPFVIGLAEYVDLPDWGVLSLRAKVDTGARSSALHVENLRELGRGRVRFEVRLHRRKVSRRVTVEALVVRRATVRSSSGVSTPRVFVETYVRIGPVLRKIELGLVDRGQMIYRMLLGRTALGNQFLVDPSRRYLLSRSARKRPSEPASADSAKEPQRNVPRDVRRRRVG